jgi:hypothetical protein
MSLESTRSVASTEMIPAHESLEGGAEDGPQTDEGRRGPSREAAFLQSGVCLERELSR